MNQKITDFSYEKGLFHTVSQIEQPQCISYESQVFLVFHVSNFVYYLCQMKRLGLRRSNTAFPI